MAITIIKINPPQDLTTFILAVVKMHTDEFADVDVTQAGENKLQLRHDSLEVLRRFMAELKKHKLDFRESIRDKKPFQDT